MKPAKPKTETKQKSKSQKPKPQRSEGAPVAVNVPKRSIHYEILPGPAKYPGSIRIKGSDLLANITNPSGETSGTVYKEIYMNPREFDGTRLALFAQLYEKYLFSKMDLEYVPAVASSQKGSIGVSYDPDIDDPTPMPNLTGMREFFSFPGTAVDRVWVPSVCKAKLTSPETGFYCDTNATEDRTSYQGQFYVWCSAPTGIATNDRIGDAWLHFDAIFFSPQLGGAVRDVYQATNDGTTNFTSVDVFKPFVPGQAGSATTAGSSPIYQVLQGTGPNSRNEVVLKEGLHRLTINGTTTNATGMNIGPLAGVPYIRLFETAPAGGPQPAYSISKNAIALASVGSMALCQVLFNIPKGGAAVSWAPAGLVGGVTANLLTLNIEKLGQYMSSGFGGFAQLLT